MSESKHTPEPWEIATLRELVDTDKLYKKLTGRESKQAAAIAALREVAQAARHVVTSNTPIPDKESDYVPRRVVTSLRAALAKLEGGER